MRNDQVIKAFLNKKYGKSSNGNLISRGVTLTNYDTDLAYHDNEKIYVNIRKFSMTTSRIQKELIKRIKANDIPFETYVSSGFFEKITR